MPYTIEPPAPAVKTADKYTVEPPTAAPAAPGGAFYGAIEALPEGVQKYVPSFLKGPSALEQETTSLERVGEEEKKLGRPLTLAERLKQSPAMESPVATGFAANQIGELPSGIGANMAAAGKSDIDRTFRAAVKPGKTNDPQYMEKMRSTIDSIINYKKDLTFTDPKTGQQITGKTPENLEQFKESFGPTKAGIFKKYDDMAKKGTALGVEVPLDRAAQELSAVANDRVTQAFWPNDTTYAGELVKGIQDLGGSLSPSEVQKTIQKINSSNAAFYRNMSRGDVGKASIDATFANILREDLHTAITSSVGPGYDAFKREYGAVKAIEDDVNRQTQRVANQDAAGGGFISHLANLSSGAELIHALATFNAAPLIKGMAIKGSERILRYLRNPNRQVKKLFEAAEAAKNALPAGQATPPIVPNIPVSPFMLTNQPTNLDQMVQQSGQ
jgi:hypothetical protein